MKEARSRAKCVDPWTTIQSQQRALVISTGAGKTFSLPDRVLSEEEAGAASLDGETLGVRDFGVVGFEDVAFGVVAPDVGGFDVWSFLGL